MKVFDEKGKLFGKVNIIDLIVVVALVAVIAAVGWHFVGEDVAEAVEPEAPTITFEVVCSKVDPLVAEFAETQLDAQLMTQEGMQPGYIRDCVVSPSQKVGLDGTMVTDESVRTVTFTIEAQVAPVANAYALGTQEIRTGKQYIVKTVELETVGTIVAMDTEVENG